MVVITNAQLHSSKPELRLCIGPHPARGVSEIRDGEDRLTMVPTGNKATPLVGQTYHINNSSASSSNSQKSYTRTNNPCCSVLLWARENTYVKFLKTPILKNIWEQQLQEQLYEVIV